MEIVSIPPEEKCLCAKVSLEIGAYKSRKQMACRLKVKAIFLCGRNAVNLALVNRSKA